jgi:nicotinamide-nucleotide amidase
MFAEIIAVGSEMLTPHRQDTNSLYLTAGLNDIGVAVAFKTIVGDNRRHLTAALRIALRRADVVIVSGGLGPTEDDLTRECLAEVLHLKLIANPVLLESLHQRFAARGIVMPPNNAKQADVLEGGSILENRNGSAPGQWIDTTFPGPDGQPYRKIVILLPGPPKEIKPLFDAEVKPRLAKSLPPSHFARRVLRMSLIPESQVDARTAPIYTQFPDVETTILAGSAEIQLHFVCIKPTLATAQTRVNQLVTLIEQEMADEIFSSDDESLPEVILLLLGLHHKTLALAESCTGGLLAERITAVPNASRVFLGGAIAYSDRSKIALVDVPAYLIAEHGAVSDPVARSLAEGIRRRTGASLGLAITGIAGPAPATGHDAAKPIGLVFIALADGEDTQCKQLQISGDRDRIRLFATQHALELIRQYLQ